MAKYLVYVHTNKINGKKYVGMTSKSLEERKRDGYHTDFEEDIKAYGWSNFESVVIKDNLTIEEAGLLEASLIKQYNSVEFGYNRQLGGIRGKHSEESKDRMSKSATGRRLSEETKKKISIKSSKYRHSEETKKKISNSNKGIVKSQEWIDKIQESRRKSYQEKKEVISCRS